MLNDAIQALRLNEAAWPMSISAPLLLASYPHQARIRFRNSTGENKLRAEAGFAVEHWKEILHRLEFHGSQAVHSDAMQRGKLRAHVWTLVALLHVVQGDCCTDPLGGSLDEEANILQHYWLQAHAYTLQIIEVHALEERSRPQLRYEQKAVGEQDDARRAAFQEVQPGSRCLVVPHFEDPPSTMALRFSDRLPDAAGAREAGGDTLGDKLRFWSAQELNTDASVLCLAVPDVIAELIIRGSWKTLVTLARWHWHHRKRVGFRIGRVIPQWPPAAWFAEVQREGGRRALQEPQGRPLPNAMDMASMVYKMRIWASQCLQTLPASEAQHQVALREAMVEHITQLKQWSDNLLTFDASLKERHAKALLHKLHCVMEMPCPCCLEPFSPLQMHDVDLVHVSSRWGGLHHFSKIEISKQQGEGRLGALADVGWFVCTLVWLPFVMSLAEDSRTHRDMCSSLLLVNLLAVPSCIVRPTLARNLFKQFSLRRAPAHPMATLTKSCSPCSLSCRPIGLSIWVMLAANMHSQAQAQ